MHAFSGRENNSASLLRKVGGKKKRMRNEEFEYGSGKKRRRCCLVFCMTSNSEHLASILTTPDEHMSSYREPAKESEGVPTGPIKC